MARNSNSQQSLFDGRAPAPKKKVGPRTAKKKSPAKAKRESAKPAKVLVETREQWLMQGVDALRPIFTEAGYEVPERVRVSCGFPGGGSARKRIGEAWDPSAANDHVAQIFISPTIEQGTRALDILAHELVHVTVGNKHGHKKPFKDCATAIGLTGKMTATVAGDELLAKLTEIVSKLGDYPHAGLNLSSRKKQTTRMVKVACKDPECECGGYTVRTTRKWIETGCPRCPMGTEMEVA